MPNSMLSRRICTGVVPDDDIKRLRRTGSAWVDEKRGTARTFPKEITVGTISAISFSRSKALREERT